MVTHDQEEGLTMADRIVVMNHGVIEQVGTPTEIYRDPDTLFVADFIGEMNQVEGEVLFADKVQVGSLELTCIPHEFDRGAKVIAAIRPEDIVPHDDNKAKKSGNVFEATISSMEFLGSFWRADIVSTELADAHLSANFSINACRRMSLSKGKAIYVDLPAERLKIFARPN